MPRSPSTYSLPPGTTPQVPNTVISSSMFTAFADDVAQTFNTVQPEAYGGTGASTYAQARANLGAAATIDIRGQIYGLTLSNNLTDATNDIDIAAGSAVDTTGVASMQLLVGITKRLDAAWAVGTGNGGLDTGSIAADTIYYVYLIRRPDTGVVDAIFSTNGTSPTLPANYTQYRRIGWFRRVGTSIWAFRQVGDQFTLSSPFQSFTGGAFGTARSLQPTGAAPLSFCKFRVTFSSSNTGVAVAFTSSFEADAAVSFQSASNNLYYGGAGNTNSVDAGEIWAQVDVSGLIAVKTNSASTTVTTYLAGWTDDRGRNG